MIWEETEEVVNTSTAEQAIRLMKQGFTQREVADMLGVSRERVNAIKSKAIKDGKLTEDEIIKDKVGRKPLKVAEDIEGQESQEVDADNAKTEEVEEAQH